MSGLRVSAESFTDAEGRIDPDAVASEIEAIADAAERDRTEFDPPDDPPDVERAMSFLTDGVGRVLGVYILLRSGDRHYRFSADEFAALEGAMHEWLALFAACHDVDAYPEPPVRTAAELLLDTNDLRAVARALTGVPDERS